MPMKREAVECDECGREDVVGDINGMYHYCTRHEEEVKQMWEADLIRCL